MNSSDELIAELTRLGDERAQGGLAEEEGRPVKSRHQIRRGRAFAIRQRVNREADRREQKWLDVIAAEALATHPNRYMRTLGELGEGASMTDADFLNLMSLLRRIEGSLAMIAANTRPRMTVRVGEVEYQCNCPEVGTSGSCPFHDAWGSGGAHPERMVP
jgi:hypothetical protein